jgi:cyanate permease
VGQRVDGDRVPLPNAALNQLAPSRVYQTDEEWYFRDVMRSGGFWLLLACSIGVSAVYTIFHAQAVLHIRDLGYSTQTAAYLLSLSVAVGFVSHMLISVLADRVEPKQMWAVSLAIQGIGIGLFAVADRPWLLYPSIMCLGAGGSSSILCLIMVFSNWFGARAAPFVFGWGSVFSAACGALAPVASGYCYDVTGTFAPVFLGTAILCGVGAAALWAAKPPRLRAASQAARG